MNTETMEIEFTNSKLNNIYTTLEQGINKFLVYTKCTPTVCTLCLTDTKIFWSKNFTINEINGEASTLKFESKENYISYLSNSIMCSDVDVTRKEIENEEILTLQIGKLPTIQVNCRKWLDVNKEQELQNLLFNMARHSSHLAKELNKMKRGANSQAQAEYQSGMVLHDLSTRQKGAAPKIRHKPGMSVLNPNSKKLKGEKGIVFD